MARKEILKKRNEYFQKINDLNKYALSPKLPYDKGREIINERNELIKKYRFFNGLLKENL